MKDVVARFDFCSSLLVAVALHATARQVAHHLPRYAPVMLWGAVAVLLAVGGLGYAQVRPRDGTEVVGIAVVAWICAAAAALAVAVLLPPLASLREGWKRMTRVRPRPPAPVSVREEEQRRAEAARAAAEA